MVKLNYLLLGLGLGLVGMNAYADSSTLDAAIGGGLGGAIGAAVGNEIGGREGAMIGGAIGGATGAAVTTDDDYHHRHHYRDQPYYIQDYYHGSRGHFCPPGQAKKGRC